LIDANTLRNTLLSNREGLAPVELPDPIEFFPNTRVTASGELAAAIGAAIALPESGQNDTPDG